MRSAGQYALGVYLFQDVAARAMGMTMGVVFTRAVNPSLGAMAYPIVLWAFVILYTYWVETPCRLWLRRVLEAFFDRGCCGAGTCCGACPPREKDQGV